VLAFTSHLLRQVRGLDLSSEVYGRFERDDLGPDVGLFPAGAHRGLKSIVALEGVQHRLRGC